MYTIIGGDGKEYGPVSAGQVRAWIAAGRADEDTKAKASDTDEWKTLADFPEISGGGPPPLIHSAGAAPALAGRGQRLGAALLDTIFGLACILPGTLMVGVNTVLQIARGEWSDDIEFGRVAGGFALLGFALLFLVVLQTWMLVTRGQTVGKRIVGIRIVRFRDGAPPGFVHAVLLRSWVPALIGLVRIVGPFVPFVDIGFIFGPDRRCLHDLIADTKVVVAEKPRQP